MQTNADLLKVVRHNNAIPINPYEFMGGVDCMTSIMSIAKMIDARFDAGSWLTPMFIRSVDRVSDDDICIVLDMIREQYSSVAEFEAPFRGNFYSW